MQLALWDDGIYWPDELYQSIEPAHRLVYGYGLVAWEFVAGARTWAMPALVASIMETSRAFGLNEPHGYLLLVRLVFCAISVLTAWGSYRLARALGASEFSAAVGAAFFSLAAPVIYFAPKAMSEVASALPVTFGLAFVLPRKAPPRSIVLGASLLGVAVLLRLQNGLFCAGLLGILAARRDVRALRVAALTLVASAAIYGLLDRLTWGSWFQSAIVYVRFNTVESGAASQGTSDVLYYMRTLFRAMPAAAMVFCVLAGAGARRAAGLFALILLFFLAHTIEPHKELRFILPILPLWGALAGVGLSELLSSPRIAIARAGRGLATIALMAVIWSGAAYRTLVFRDLGAHEGFGESASAFQYSGDINRLLEIAGRLSDVCGLKIESSRLVWTGGYAYFHNPARLYDSQKAGRESRFFNYVIDAHNAPGRLIASDGNTALLRIADTCEPDPKWTDRLQ